VKKRDSNRSAYGIQRELRLMKTRTLQKSKATETKEKGVTTKLREKVEKHSDGREDVLLGGCEGWE